MNVLEKIQSFLQEQKSQQLKNFNVKLIPNIHGSTVLGVKLPVLRKFAKELYKEYDLKPFLQNLPHTYHEENHLHAFIIEQVKDYDKCLSLTQEFLPFVDNWAVCDCFKPKAFKTNKQKLLLEIKKWITSAHTYKIRFAISMLLTHFLDSDFNEECLHLVQAVKSDEYYVNMVRAWYFATALTKQYDKTLPVITQNKLDVWTHNKTIQKAIESFRITKEQKEYLKKFKIK